MYLRVNGTHAFSDTQVIYWERKKSFVELAITNELTLYITLVDSRVNTPYASSLLHYELNVLIINTTKNSFDVQFSQLIYWSCAFGIFTLPLGLSECRQHNASCYQRAKVTSTTMVSATSESRGYCQTPTTPYLCEKSTDSSRCRLDNDATHSCIDIMVGECPWLLLHSYPLR